MGLKTGAQDGNAVGMATQLTRLGASQCLSAEPLPSWLRVCCDGGCGLGRLPALLQNPKGLVEP